MARDTVRIRPFFTLAVSLALVGITAGVGSGTPAPGAERWVKAQPDLNRCAGVVATATALVGAGSEVNVGTKRDGVVTAYDQTDGSMDWQFVYDGAAHGQDYLDQIAATPDGSVVFAGGSENDSSRISGGVLIAIDTATGDPMWTSNLWNPDGIRGQSATLTGIVASPDGATVYATSWFYWKGLDWDVVTQAFDVVTGDPLWQDRFARPARLQSDELSYSIAVSAAGGRVFVGGESYFPQRSVVLAYDAATGARIWTRMVHEWATYVVTTAPGIVYALSDRGNVVRGLSAPNGSTRWAQELPRRDEYTSIVADATGAVFGVGTRSSLATRSFLMAGYDGSGQRRWKEAYTGGSDVGDFGRAIALAPDGSGVYATGYVNGSLDPPVSQADAVTLRRDAATGALDWAATAAGPGDVWDAGEEIVVSGDGSTVGVCGSTPSPWSGAFTAAYEG